MSLTRGAIRNNCDSNDSNDLVAINGSRLGFLGKVCDRRHERDANHACRVLSSLCTWITGG